MKKTFVFYLFLLVTFFFFSCEEIYNKGKKALKDKNEEMKGRMRECYQDKAVKLDTYMFKRKVPLSNQITLRNDSLVISETNCGEYDDTLKLYDKTTCYQSSRYPDSFFLINKDNGKVIDNLSSYSPRYNRSKFQTAIYSTDTNKIITEYTEITIVNLYEDYKGYKINLERRDSKTGKLNCIQGDRIAIYQNNNKLVNYRIWFGIGDYVLDNKYLYLLTDRATDENRQLIKVSLDQLIEDVKKRNN